MDEMQRMQSDITMLTRRTDDHAFKIATLEASDKHVDEKFDALRELIELKLTNMKSSIDGWNRIGLGLLMAFLGAIIVAIVAFMVAGGFHVR